MKKLLIAFSLFLAVNTLSAQPPQVPADAGATFGKVTTAENAVSMEQYVQLLESKGDGKPLEGKIIGIVKEVCQKEGCWIKVESPNGNLMVKMKDHKFAVPVVLNGKKVVIDGVGTLTTTSVKQLKHYAEDAGKSKEEIAKITEPKKEIVIQAAGILVL
ncbi:MAG: DUF4920 domain-containing protein [Sediminibacterium sp.]|uniref:DUF4920 domain-containing protein n=1 Tax=Sediminibacterium sp. TaxID=1917865 RepID=UPI002ABA10FB|nr:DUF4920 domain-containing protein [Sediminibacterium sp.]MDZ4072935.1 DUF4920 domain-containing protein [Sediminibacterium sp.]